MWTVEYTKRFLKELVGLPAGVQSRIEKIVFQDLKSENPFADGLYSSPKSFIHATPYQDWISSSSASTTHLGLLYGALGQLAARGR